MRCAYVAVLALGIVGVAPTPAQSLLINNGLAPPNPGNVVTTTEAELIVRNVGCGSLADPSGACAMPGAATEVELSGGGRAEFLQVREGSILRLGPGAVHPPTSPSGHFLGVRDSASLHAQGAALGGIGVSGAAHLELTNSTVFADLTLSGDATATLQGGGSGSNASVSLRDSAFASFTDHGTFALAVSDHARAVIDGGFLTNGLLVDGDARVEKLGGDTEVIAPLQVFDRAKLTVRGGTARNLFVRDQGVIELIGSDFLLDGQPVALGDVVPARGNLSGVLESGEAFSGSYDKLAGGGVIRLTAIPEPGTAVLVGCGLFGLALRRRGPSA